MALELAECTRTISSQFHNFQLTRNKRARETNTKENGVYMHSTCIEREREREMKGGGVGGERERESVQALLFFADSVLLSSSLSKLFLPVLRGFVLQGCAKEELLETERTLASRYTRVCVCVKEGVCKTWGSFIAASSSVTVRKPFPLM